MPARSHAQRDTSGLIMQLAVGVSVEPLDLDLLNERLDAAHLHPAKDLPANFRCDLVLAGNRFFFDLGVTSGFTSERTDSSHVNTSAFSLQLGFGYPVVRTSRMLVAPMVGYRFAGFNYAHYLEPKDPAFNTALLNGSGNVELSHMQSQLLLGAYASMGSRYGVAVQAGYLVPLGNGTWRTTGGMDRLSNAPRIDPGLLVAVSFVLHFDLHPGRWLPYC